MTIRQHRIIQYIAITLILLAGAGWYYNVKVRGAQTVNNDSPSFQADLKNTLDLQAGVGVPTFARATTATVTDFEGLIKPVKSGEARFEGARRVENLLAGSEAFNNEPPWYGYCGATTRTAGFSDPNGGMNAWKLDTGDGCSVLAGGILVFGGTPGRTYTASVWMKVSSGTLSTNFGVDDGSTTGITLDTTWRRYSYTGVSNGRLFQIREDTASPVSIYIYHPQTEDVTGQANQNPSEYVSTNVLTSAPYHGANVDGVKYFTTQNGNTVASNVVTEATGAAIPDATLHGYVAEGARTNLALYSEQLNQWDARATADQLLSPSGSVTADLLTAASGSYGGILRKNSPPTYSINTTYTLSVYVKAGTANVIGLRPSVGAADSGDVYPYFNLTTGVATAITPRSGTINAVGMTNVGGGWWRCYITYTLGGTNGGDITDIAITNSTGGTAQSYAGTETVYLWGAQLEAGAFASSYIPTTTASVTRAEDQLSYPTSGNVLSTTGSAYAEVSQPNGETTFYGTFLGGTSGDRTLMFRQSGHLQMFDGTNSSQGSAFSPSTSLQKLGITWGAVTKNAVGGILSSVLTFGGSFNLGSGVSIGYNAGFLTERNSFSTIRNVKIWKKALTDGQLTNMTSTNASVAQSAVKSTTVGADGSSFQADLKNTLDLQAGVGVPTFARATTATVTDFEGLIKNVKSGEARFEGARRVENILPNSQNVSVWNNDGTGNSVTSATEIAPDGSNTAALVSFPAGSSWRYSYANIPSGHSFIASIWLKSSAGPIINLVAQEMGGGYVSYASANPTLTNQWKRYTISGVKGSDSDPLRFVVANYTGSSQQVYIWGAQLEEVTGQSNQNPSEYVSTNVLTSAPYHGANVDGVKYFTTQNGNTVASNVVTEATGAAIADSTLHGYVAEGARTNLVLQSEDFSTTWNNIGSPTISINSTISPSGATTADLWTRTTTAASYAYQVMGKPTSALPYTMSAYVKSNTGRYVALAFQGTYPNNVKATYDLQTGTISIASFISGTFTSPSASISSVGNGWYRVTLSATTDTFGAVSYYAGFNSNNIVLDDADSSSSSSGYIWGAQLEAGAFASSYIPTTTASVTRNADVLTYPTAGNVDNSVGSSYAEVIAKFPQSQVSTYNRIISTTGASITTPLYVRADTMRLGLYDGSGERLSSNSFLPNVFSRTASKWYASNSAVSLNGTLTNLVFDGNMNLSDIAIGTDGLSSDYLFGTIRNVKIWKKALTDGQLTDMTSTNTAVAQSAVKKTIVNASQNTKLTSGLVGLWSFNGTDISGTTAYDRSGQGNNGTLTGGVTKTIGKVGQALSFSGTQRVTADKLFTTATDNITFSEWVYWNGDTSGWIPFYNGNAGSNGYGFIVSNGSCGAGNKIGILLGGVNCDVLASSYVLPTNTWTHIVGMRDSGTWKLYVNGILAVTGGTGAPSTPTYEPGTGVSSFSGKIDEVRIYNRALSTTEVSALYNLGR